MHEAGFVRALNLQTLLYHLCTMMGGPSIVCFCACAMSPNIAHTIMALFHAHTQAVCDDSECRRGSGSQLGPCCIRIEAWLPLSSAETSQSDWLTSLTSVGIRALVQVQIQSGL
ncbi:hypothetical protein BDV40DRAFT_258172 [Aspergillus tamarii]|uniref:Uncharacterized protein n=1 Tax=Aspergillus tamarii TaxID=41984 RepID=A0A5N6V3N4_ASPTM|nr:hypothetical protein BDV40DRAFT_258172 [Aspergillus tamarii]